MKYAIAYEQEQVFQHFGKCPAFLVVELKEGKVEKKWVLDAQGSGHSALVTLLQNEDIETLVCGGIGQGARNALQEAEIALISGAKGHVDIIINKLSKGTLADDPSGMCNHHEEGHTHHCGESDHCH